MHLSLYPVLSTALRGASKSYAHGDEVQRGTLGRVPMLVAGN